jgi:hypothetical protein
VNVLLTDTGTAEFLLGEQFHGTQLGSPAKQSRSPLVRRHCDPTPRVRVHGTDR